MSCHSFSQRNHSIEVSAVVCEVVVADSQRFQIAVGLKQQSVSECQGGQGKDILLYLQDLSSTLGIFGRQLAVADIQGRQRPEVIHIQ